ncbi:hypothetical protein CC85DRAFT_325224 [Cutaneotrichosporon oleaginosum]|uniref:Uncharacterized protein n=1 Tax=Cutaneotrichosporon oleaginosum TaxID=879819 RepID=A0A0J0XY43_9TREE|nr:uncharacterized protein CC85DRAFT_325224 [Cutaneotrichosporon oleaginosum]KLT45958.1 hypothetical protein CC85DRAFT_325224 [Cutaneotrichosporon oleaginosum]TXT06653.1 hypothetical protein COLE_05984 [Cutaneotrichosporon oleaginosum]
MNAARMAQLLPAFDRQELRSTSPRIIAYQEAIKSCGDIQPQSHPFFRLDMSNAFLDPKGYKLAHIAFPCDIAFVGCVILTEPWLVPLVLPPNLRVRYPKKIAEIQKYVTDLRDGLITFEQGRDMLYDLWEFFQDFDIRTLDRVIADVSLYVFHRNANNKFGCPSHRKYFTKLSQIAAYTNWYSQSALALEAGTQLWALVQLMQLGCKGAKMCTRTATNDSCMCFVHVHPLFHLSHYPRARDVRQRWACSGTGVYDFNHPRKFAIMSTADKGWLQHDIPYPGEEPKATVPISHLVVNKTIETSAPPTAILTPVASPSTSTRASTASSTPLHTPTTPYTPWAQLVAPPVKTTKAAKKVRIVTPPETPRPQQAVVCNDYTEEEAAVLAMISRSRYHIGRTSLEWYAEFQGPGASSSGFRTKK